MKIKLNANDELPLNKTIEIPIIPAFMKITNIIHKFS